MDVLDYCRHVTVLIDRGYSWEQALDRLSVHKGSPDNGFYMTRREVRGKHLFVLATLKEGSGHIFKITRYGCKWLWFFILAQYGSLI